MVNISLEIGEVDEAEVGLLMSQKNSSPLKMLLHWLMFTNCTYGIYLLQPAWFAPWY